MPRHWFFIFCLTLFIGFGFASGVSFAADGDIDADAVLKSIERSKDLLVELQNADGSWGDGNDWHVGDSALALVALLNAEMTAKDDPIRQGVRFLRSSKPTRTYEVALKAMALADAKTGTDGPELQILANLLEQGQIKTGKNTGLWSYSCSKNGFNPGNIFGGDRSNSQYAILGLRAAVAGGAKVQRETWLRAQTHWTETQNGDGSWSYGEGKGGSGSMTVAGIATLTITLSMLRSDGDYNADGSLNCCGDKVMPDAQKAIDRGVSWVGKNFRVRSNPGAKQWLLYYLYGMERAGRLSGQRFFGKSDWYREGAEYLVGTQDPIDGSWRRSREENKIRGTSFALLFLSKGLAPVVVSKLKYGPRDPRVPETVVGENRWNQHRNDARNLTELLTGLRGWPKMLNWQTLDIHTVARYGSVTDLLQSKLLYMSGTENPEFTEQEISLLRQYVDEGGYIFAVNSCQTVNFEKGFRDLIKLMYPGGEAELKPLEPDHPVFRSEYVIQPDSIELHGVDIGCRTSIFYSPTDIACGWHMWTQQKNALGHEVGLAAQTRILRDTRIGVNMVAYCTGREPPKRLEKVELVTEDDTNKTAVERGLLQIAKLRHEGGWDAAPQAVRNLLVALNKTVGLAASPRQKELPATDPKIYQYPVMYMHGRHSFRLTPRETEQIKTYVERGNVLIADACCGSTQFDTSFREMVSRAFPNQKFERIPVSHEIFNADVNHDIRKIRRRASTKTAKAGLVNDVNWVEPYLEGIKINGRYAVIYSKYDISCALERQTSVACSGYIHEDAVKLAVNMVLYAMLQQIE